MRKMAGYEITDEDIQTVTKWLSVEDPKNANVEFARELLFRVKMLVREIGKDDITVLEKAHKELLEG